jgi:hypothetical protein
MIKKRAMNMGASSGGAAMAAAAAGNQDTTSGMVITGYPWVIPAAACDLRGKQINESNLGHSIGRRGLRAQGDQITSLGAQGQPHTLKRNTHASSTLRPA